MKFAAILNERNYSRATLDQKDTRREYKADLLQASGYEVVYNYVKDELLVVKDDGDIVNIFNDTSAVRFYYKTDEAMEKWKKIYHELFADVGVRKTEYEKKDGSLTKSRQQRYTPSDFLIRPDLKKKLRFYVMNYDQFMKELAKDVRVSFK